MFRFEDWTENETNEWMKKQPMSKENNFKRLLKTT